MTGVSVSWRDTEAVSEQGRGVEAPRVVAPGVGLVSADVAEPVTGDRQTAELSAV
jgi:hypothetical protein